jgi:hypothetical protein
MTFTLPSSSVLHIMMRRTPKENKMLRRTAGSKRVGVRGRWRKLHKDFTVQNLHNILLQ